jgi:hypothetical protein
MIAKKSGIENKTPFKSGKEALKFMIFYWDSIQRLLSIVQDNGDIFNAKMGDNIFDVLANFLEEYIEFYNREIK